LQNTLEEYYHLINFVWPNYLGSKNVFLKEFINPIMKARSAEATNDDVKLMKERAHVLRFSLEEKMAQEPKIMVLPQHGSNMATKQSEFYARVKARSKCRG
jgi:SNF2 family DNA or RNA helicase